MRTLFKCFLAFSSITFLLVIFLIKDAYWIPRLGIWSITIYLVVVVTLAVLCLRISDYLSSDSIEGGVESIELANEAYLPSYLGYFFVALSIPNFLTLAVVFSIIFTFLLCSQTLYYNPLFLLFGFKYYFLTLTKGVKILVITREALYLPEEVSFENLKRINDFTFIDRGAN